MLIELLKFQSILNCPACQRFVYVEQTKESEADEASAAAG
jgi:uncharacterized protein YbaR (Trm112 family)